MSVYACVHAHPYVCTSVSVCVRGMSECQRLCPYMSIYLFLHKCVSVSKHLCACFSVPASVCLDIFVLVFMCVCAGVHLMPMSKYMSSLSLYQFVCVGAPAFAFKSVCPHVYVQVRSCIFHFPGVWVCACVHV